MNYKENITSIPNQIDGVFEIFKIVQNDDIYPIEDIISTGKKMYFEELSVTDKLRFQAQEREIDITMKIRIPQTKQIDSMTVLKIGNCYHKVYNAYHFTNNDGFKMTDLTLTKYKKVA